MAENMISLTAWKKKMKKEYRMCVDLEPGETFDMWLETYLMVLEDDGFVIRKGKRTYIIED